MMKRSRNILRSTFHAALPVFAALGLSTTALAAEEEAKAEAAPAEQVNAEAAAQAVAEGTASRDAAQTNVDPALEELSRKAREMRDVKSEKLMNAIKEAERKAREGAPIDALRDLNALKADFDAEIMPVNGRKVMPPYLEGVYTKWEQLRKDISRSTAEDYYEQAKDLYSSALHNYSVENMDKCYKAKGLLSDALPMFYLGVTPGEFWSEDALDEAKLTDKREFATRVNKLFAGCNKILAAGNFNLDTNRDAVDPAHEVTQDYIQKMYTKAEKLYRAKRYTDARDMAEEILKKDAFNQDAVRLLEKIYKKLYFYAELRSYNEMLRNDAEMIWSWVPAVVDYTQDDDKNVERVRKVDNSKLQDKLSSLIISVSMKDYTLPDAITYIRNKCKERDPEKIGINIVPKLSDEPNTDVKTKRITLELDNVPVNQVLKYLCDMVGNEVRYKIQDNFVYIGTALSNYETQYFTFSHNAYQSIVSESEDAGTDDTDSGPVSMSTEDFGKTASRTVSKDDSRLKSYFEDMGFVFDEMSGITYEKRANKLRIVNTREQLRQLGPIIAALDVETPLILIEAKILEVKVTDLEELGFDWVMTHTPKARDAGRANTWGYNMNTPLRSANTVLGSSQGLFASDKILNNLNILPNFNMGSLGDFDLYLTINALDRMQRVEILSTPKVIASNGETANVNMVRQMYFPDSWNETDTSNINGDSMEFQPSYPEFGDPTDIGISFEVTPTAGTMNSTIMLDLRPTITDLSGWTDYSYDVIIKGTPESDPDEPSENKFVDMSTRITMKMPEISERMLMTNVKVASGQTLVVGGMMSDKQSSMEDRFPILGDIPVIGRLFSKSATKVERSNLLISVTPRFIGKDGPKRNSDNGLPDFKR